MKTMIFLILIAFSFLVNSAEHKHDPKFWMARETLKNDLVVRKEPSSTSNVLYKVKKYQALKHIRRANYNKWVKIETKNGHGYVYKKSIVPFDIELNYLQNLVATEVTIHKVNKMVYFGIGSVCYNFDLATIETLPEGKDNALTIKSYLNEIGGFKETDENIVNNCNFR